VTSNTRNFNFFCQTQKRVSSCQHSAHSSSVSTPISASVLHSWWLDTQISNSNRGQCLREIR
jgi:hypothetical protein